MIDVLARPVVDLIAAFGSGALPAGSPAASLRAASEAIDAAHAVGRTGISELGGTWTGVAADAAVTKAEATQSASVQLSDRGREIATVVEAASESVRAGNAELAAILQSFLSLASSALPALATPAGQMMLIGAATEHLGRALTVVERVRGELAAHTAKIVDLTAPDPVPNDARTVAASAPFPRHPWHRRPMWPGGCCRRSRVLLGPVGSFGSSAGDVAPVAYGSGSYGSGSAVASTESGSAGGSTSYDPRFGGSGVEIVLPDGTTAVAPNEEAADAVRNALTQQGVPYQWGGTTPGQGLDCSGLTQWAYREAGVELPRLAQEQSVGVPVAQENVMPGDLAVWDGHVAMVIGNGQMVEAGDPVSVSAIEPATAAWAFTASTGPPNEHPSHDRSDMTEPFPPHRRRRRPRRPLSTARVPLRSGPPRRGFRSTSASTGANCATAANVGRRDPAAVPRGGPGGGARRRETIDPRRRARRRARSARLPTRDQVAASQRAEDENQAAPASWMRTA